MRGDLSNFIMAVLDPLPTETLADREYNSLSRRVRADAWSKAEANWRACQAILDLCYALQVSHRHGNRHDVRMPDRELAVAASNQALATLLLTPVKWQINVDLKRSKLRRVPYLPVSAEAVAAAIAADEAFLAAHPVKRSHRK